MITVVGNNDFMVVPQEHLQRDGMGWDGMGWTPLTSAAAPIRSQFNLIHPSPPLCRVYMCVCVCVCVCCYLVYGWMDLLRYQA